MTDQICAGRNYAKQIDGFRAMQIAMHGDDWEKVVDADTSAIIRHAQSVKKIFS